MDFFYSDPHFGHVRIIELCQRPFADVEHMNAELIRRYNARVGCQDVVVWCGDCFFGPTEFAADILRELHGHKVLVRGNHDRSAAAMARIGFDVVADHLTTYIAGTICRIAHRPYPGTDSPEDHGERGSQDYVPKRAKGEVLIHGHVHAKWRRQGNQVHVGVDAWDYAPAAFYEVGELVAEVRKGAQPKD